MKPADLTAAIREAVQTTPDGDPDSMTDSLIRQFGVAWIGISLRAHRAAVAGRISRMQARLPDPRQLDLPGFAHVIVRLEETLDHYRAVTAKLAYRLRSYDYARRTPANRKNDEATLRERLKLDAKISPYFASDPTMTVSKAIERYRIALESPARKHRRGTQKGKLGSTKNQRLP